MPKAAPLPPQFADLGVQYAQRVSETEFSSECPECGGVVHRNGDWPDRLRIFTDSHPRIWCRRCNLFRWADQVNDTEPPSKADLDAWRHEQIQREEERKRSAELALQNLRDEERWAVYYGQLDTVGRDYWRKRGIPSAWQDFWQFGWNPQSRWGTPTATIPLFGLDWQVLNIKHRLIGNDEPGRKYRYELHGMGAPLFRTDPDASLAGHVFAVEGEIKAAVVKVTLDDNTAVVGLPGATPPTDTVAELQQTEHVTLVMDPGAELETQRLVDMLGHKRCSVLVPPMKIDDGILATHMTGRELKMMLTTARKP